MKSHALRIAWRHLRKNATFSIINLLGLSLGLAAAMAVLLYVQDEFSYEAFHQKADRIVRVNLEASFDGELFRLSGAPNAMGPFLQRRLPEAAAVARLFHHDFGQIAFLRAEGQNFTEKNFYWADSSLLDIFSLEFVAGTPAGALDLPGAVILSQSNALRLFGSTDVLGRTMKVDNSYDLEVKGVFRDLPPNTHFPLQAVGSFSTISFGKPDRQTWDNASFTTFLLLHQGKDPAEVETKVLSLLNKELPEDRLWFTPSLQPMRQIHLYTQEMAFSREVYGDIRQLRILIGLAILLLLIACINYMNLATAKSQQRAREVAVSKTLGASRPLLMRQFYTETGLLALMGIALSVLILAATLPFFNQLSGKMLSMRFLGQPWFWLGIAGIWALVTLVAGAYPAAFLSSAVPIDMFRQNLRASSGAGLLRRVLVVFQFSVSTILIICTLVFFRQLNFIRDQKLGYNPEQVLAIRIGGAENRAQVEALQKELLSQGVVLNTGLSQTYPGSPGSGRSLRRPGQENGAMLTSCHADPSIFEVLDLKMLAGQAFRQTQEGDSIGQVVLNRSAVELLGWTPDQAIGQRVEADLGATEIAGVVEDFHFGSLHQAIGNFAFHNVPYERKEYLLVKLQTERLLDVMRQLQETFQRVVPESAFDYVFLDDHLASLYETERRMSKVMLLFACLAIVVACLGLFALVAFAAEQRRKEIGIRKVLGATLENLIGLLSKDFLLLVAISILVAIPLAWLAMNRWLESFAYHAGLSWWIFAAAAGLALLIALLTVWITSLRTVLANPVQALREGS